MYVKHILVTSEFLLCFIPPHSHFRADGFNTVLDHLGLRNVNGFAIACFLVFLPHAHVSRLIQRSTILEAARVWSW